MARAPAMVMHHFELISRQASKQAGLIARRQLINFGLRPWNISDAVRSKQLLHAPQRTVYRLPGTAVSDDLDFWSALLWAGPPAFISHVSAGWLWGLGGLGWKRPKSVDVIIDHGRVLGPPRGIEVHRSRSFLPGKHSSNVRGIPCTSLERTLVDLSRVLSPLDLDKALDSASRRFPKIKETTWKLADHLHRRGMQGVGGLVQLSARPSLGSSGSDLEVEVREVLREAGLLPLPQFSICDEHGDQIGVFDFCWPEARLVLEVHSRSWHATWNAVENDLSKADRLKACGWNVITITARRLRADPARFVARVRREIALGRQGG